ncbi:MAG: hypothetical protein RPU64_00225 [Candidatus Sedimenticola sp. (ex Thyasira tokunagai)]
MAAIVFYQYAARLGFNLFFEGAVSRQLLENLERFGAIWSSWKPDIYNKITLAAEMEADDKGIGPAGDRAILAYSGGVDSNAVLIRHMNGIGRATRSLEAALLIHGLDIPLTEPQGFIEAKKRATEGLDAFGLPLAVVRTNIMDIAGNHWNMEHGTALTSCLHAYSGDLDYGLLAEDFHYGHLEESVAWGNNPLTIPLISSGRFAIRPDGGELTRIEKVDLLAKYPVIVKNLRVCFVTYGGNCGLCEKCTRTQLNFLLKGHDPTPLFPNKITFRRLIRVRIRSQVASWKVITKGLPMAGQPFSWRIAIRIARLKSSFLNHLHAIDAWRRGKFKKQ